MRFIKPLALPHYEHNALGISADQVNINDMRQTVIGLFICISAQCWFCGACVFCSNAITDVRIVVISTHMLEALLRLITALRMGQDEKFVRIILRLT